MKNISPELDAHFAGECTTVARCWRITRTDDVVVTGTTLDRDIIFDGVTYLAIQGYSATDIEVSSELNVDNLEIQGFLLDSPSLNEADLRAGRWDFAAVQIFQVNYEDLTQGSISDLSGTLGEITIERGQFKAEFRSKSQAYMNILGILDTPGCQWVLGDSNCRKDLTDFTVTVTITGVHPDGVTLYDTDRSEPGPADGVAITGISNANPGVVTTDPQTFVPGEAVQISEVVGPDLLNLTTIVRNPTATSFELGVDTSDTGVYPTYISGGLVTPLGIDSGFFGFGKITFTSGLNTGLSQDVRFSTVGQWTLALPMPYLVQIGDTYTMVAGCNKSFNACKVKFDNLINKSGFDYLPGIDKIVQVGRQS